MTGIGADTPFFLTIDDPEDPRLDPYCRLRERDLRGHGDRFVAEGEVVLRVLLGTARFAAESILVSERRAGRVAEMLAGLADPPPVYVAAQRVMDAVVGFHIHRGILAVGRRLPEPAPGDFVAALPGEATVLCLVGIANHDNVGGIFRNAAAFGVDAVLIDEATCDPLYRKAIRVSVGAALIVPYVRVESGAEMLELLDGAGFRTYALSPAGEQALQDLEPPRRTAIMVGAEGPGLPADLMAKARTVRIDIAPGFDSLNVATTTGIALYAVTRRLRRPRAGARP